MALTSVATTLDRWLSIVSILDLLHSYASSVPDLRRQSRAARPRYNNGWKLPAVQ